MFHQNFKKIRMKLKSPGVKNDEDKEILEKLQIKQDTQKELRSAECKIAKTFLNQIIYDLEEDIASKIANKNASKVQEYISEFNVIGGKFSQSGLWTLKINFALDLQTHPWLRKTHLEIW